MTRASRLLQTPVEPFRIDPDLTADQILERLGEQLCWGKMAAGANRVTVHADVTVAFPLLVTALARSARESAAIRQRPVFDLGGRAMSVDGAPLRCDVFEEPR